MPVGYLVTAGLIATCTFFALAPRRPRRSRPWNPSLFIGFLVNELPFIAFYWLLAATSLALVQSDVESPVGWAGVGLAALATAGLAVVVLRAFPAGPALDDAMQIDVPLTHHIGITTRSAERDVLLAYYCRDGGRQPLHRRVQR